MALRAGTAGYAGWYAEGLGKSAEADFVTGASRFNGCSWVMKDNRRFARVR